MGIRHEISAFGNVLKLLKGINVRPVYLAAPIALGIAAASFEGVGIGLLIPLLNGFIQHDFSFIKEAPVIGKAVNVLPENILSSDRMLFGVLMGVFMGSIILRNVFRYLSVIALSYFANRSLHHLRKELFSRYLGFGKLYFDRSNVGHHSTVLSVFSEHAMAPVMDITKYMNALFSLVMYVAIMGFISLELTVAAIPLFVILHAAVKKMIDSIRGLSVKLAERKSALGKKSIEILSTIPLVKSYSAEGMEQKNFARISDEKAQLDFRIRVVQELMLPLQEIITLLAATVLFAGMLLIIVRGGETNASPFIVYFYIILNAAGKFGTLTGFRGVLARSVGPMEEVREIFSDRGKFFVKGGNREFNGLEDRISFKNTMFSYGDGRTVIDGVSFDVEKGTMVAIVGPTGGGKTTLISLLMRYYDCRPQSIFIDGTDIREFSIKSLLKHIALVSQEIFLLHESLKYNITYGLENVSDMRIDEAVRKARLEELVSKLPDGLDTLIGDRGVKLSGGEKQRVAVARALLKQSEVLILDEATSSLDTKTERLIQEAINEVVRGRTAIVIAHRLSTIQHADKIVVIGDGKCVEQGTLDELLSAKGRFYELWEEQKFDQ